MRDRLEFTAKQGVKSRRGSPILKDKGSEFGSSIGNAHMHCQCTRENCESEILPRIILVMNL